MTLVERFIEINDWPASRKTALLCVASGLMHTVTWTTGRRAAAKAGIADVATFDQLMSAWMLLIVALLALSLLCIRLRREGAWLPYLMVFSFGGWMTALISMSGLWTSPTFAMLPLAVITVTLYYGDHRVGNFALALSLLAIAGLWALNRLGMQLPQPLTLEASHPQTEYWARVNTLGVIGFFIFCAVLSILLVSAQRLQGTRLKSAHRLISRYVPSQLADRILTGGHVASEKPERRNLTLFFSDVEGFTNASDELDPERLAALLNEYLSEMAVIAERHGATLNQFVGDGIMIFFGAPTATNDQDHALRAVRMSLEMQRRMADLQQAWFKRGFQKPFRIRIGLNTGYASVGDFGSQGRAVYSAIGLQTNLAARIQSQCEPGKILISHSTWALVHEEIPCEDRGEIQIKGIHYPVKVYEVVAADS